MHAAGFCQQPTGGIALCCLIGLCGLSAGLCPQGIRKKGLSHLAGMGLLHDCMLPGSAYQRRRRRREKKRRRRKKKKRRRRRLLLEAAQHCCCRCLPRHWKRSCAVVKCCPLPSLEGYVLLMALKTPRLPASQESGLEDR